ncbi:hypothetical protein HBN50_14940 [Halobacteriovorax sp. GB3]|uniref:hypothetical protein n=1 Tax=Halobacteriovorax sp. GB3 TaxID=2719615 RepID=UPI00236201E5|nr:hypothetical protein [Halobacteriovorax sp. GB3]MDD0854406.1 hypothetical protein [Halobacteriovorax sp. GB3]
MKKIMFSVIMLGILPTLTFAQRTERVLKDVTTPIMVKVTEENVRCSEIGYGFSELKLNVPSLRWLAVLDHSNAENLGPCVTAGACANPDLDRPGRSPLDIIINGEDLVKTDVRIILTEVFEKHDEQCFRSLEEKVELEIRGVPFKHFATKSIGTLPVEECL